MELTKSQELLAAAAEERKKSYWEKVKSNRDKLEDSLKSRPSLLERFDQSQAKNNATAKALGKIVSAIGPKSTSNSDLLDDDEKFLAMS